MRRAKPPWSEEEIAREQYSTVRARMHAANAKWWGERACALALIGQGCAALAIVLGVVAVVLAVISS